MLTTNGTNAARDDLFVNFPQWFKATPSELRSRNNSILTSLEVIQQ